MALSKNDFSSATAYLCGDKEECKKLLNIAGLGGVKIYSMRDAFDKGSKSPSLKTKAKVTAH